MLRKNLRVVKLTKVITYPTSMLGKNNLNELAVNLALQDFTAEINELDRNNTIEENFFTSVEVFNTNLNTLHEPPVQFKNRTLNNIVEALSLKAAEAKFGVFDVNQNPEIYDLHPAIFENVDGEEVLVREEQHYLKEKVSKEYNKISKNYYAIVKAAMFPNEPVDPVAEAIRHVRINLD